VLCRRHHTMLDHGELHIDYKHTMGANGPIGWYLLVGDS